MEQKKEMLIVILGVVAGIFLVITGVVIINSYIELLSLSVTLISLGTGIIIAVLGIDIGLNFIPHAKIRLETKRQTLGLTKPPPNSTVSKSENSIRKITREEIETKVFEGIATLKERLEKGELPSFLKKE